MEMHLLRWQPMNFPFRNRDTMEHRQRFLLHPGRQRAARNQLLDLGIIPSVRICLCLMPMMVMFVVLVMGMEMRMRMYGAVRMCVLMRMFRFCLIVVPMFMPVLVRVLMAVFVFMVVPVMMLVIVRKMNIKLHSFYTRFGLAPDMQMVAIEAQLIQFVLQFVRIHAEINQSANQHVAANSAKDVQVERRHFFFTF